ncbi:MAG: rhomboid family intramembrane serine protease [Bacteroidetes bacterium]|nr:MAG: rhomboid family intramembrane serine protease [Bacteroidota bacterium]
MRLDYNSPVILTYSLICVIVFLANFLTHGLVNQVITLSPYFDFLSPLSYLRLFSYIFGHASVDHILGNLSFILLLGPILEEKYGGQNLIFMIGMTALATAIINILFFSTGILGASGIVFMFIVLVSFANFKEGHIPLTFVVVMLLYVGKEVLNSFQPDNVSQFGHIAGGVCGSMFGFAARWINK